MPVSMSAIIGRITASAEEVRRRLGPDDSSCYQEQLGNSLRNSGLHVDADLEFSDCYGDVEVHHRIDLLVAETVVVEVHTPQQGTSASDRLSLLRHYMQLAKKSHGLLVTFGRESVRCKAVVHSVLIHL